MTGFKPKLKGVVITCPDGIWEPEEGSDSFQATIKRLTLGELKDLPKTTKTTTLEEMASWVAPYILAWNFLTTDVVTGEDVEAFPPAEAGPDVLYALDPIVVAWLYQELQRVHAGGADLPKEQRPSNAMAAGLPEAKEASPQPEASTRPSQQTGI